MLSFSFVCKYFLTSSLASSVIHWLLSGMLLSLQGFVCLFVCLFFYSLFSFWLISNLTALWSEKVLDMISVFLNLPRLDL